MTDGEAIALLRLREARAFAIGVVLGIVLGAIGFEMMPPIGRACYYDTLNRMSLFDGEDEDDSTGEPI